ncbi:MAG TPA: hypothetical protein IAC98_04045 [Candidatus Cryptobacteroides pullicola]|nr:hypothetical protein [Candidatus Cryptobacteroides pullicola]
MTTKRTYRITLNGTEWMIESDKWGCALYLRANRNAEFHFSGDWFRSVAEANAYLDEVDRKVVTRMPSVADVIIPATYYGEPGRYYGD